MADQIRDALERAARELALVAASLTIAGWLAAGNRARNEARVARAALEAHPPAPAAVPVAVSERPWEREGWLHPEEGWCWFGEPETEYSLGETGYCDVTEPQWVRWVPPSNLSPFELQCVSLPHWAILIPQPPQGGEVPK